MAVERHCLDRQTVVTFSGAGRRDVPHVRLADVFERDGRHGTLSPPEGWHPGGIQGWHPAQGIQEQGMTSAASGNGALRPGSTPPRSPNLRVPAQGPQDRHYVRPQLGRGRHDRYSPGATRLVAVSRYRQDGKIWRHDVKRSGSP
jgi:hypothetical protein